jgi:hypothetical protein
MEMGFDLISDLYLQPDDNFNWENKATSLYCIVAGNISEDLRTIYQTLAHLSNHYQGIFYVPGTLEYTDVDSIERRTNELHSIIKKLPKVAFLDHHVVIIDGVAILGANGWSEETLSARDAASKIKDLAYLSHSVEKLQRHLDVNQILIVTNAVPKLELWYGAHPKDIEDIVPLDICLESDTERKVRTWCYGTSPVTTDTVLGEHSINYVNNSFYKQVKPYWPKRIAIEV